MNRTLAFASLLLLAACTWPFGTAENPDPNHTHADFAVFVAGKEVDFGKDQYMSGSASDPEHKGAKHTHLHLHDEIGTVLHRHKPGLKIGEFFKSIGFTMTNDCFGSEKDGGIVCSAPGKKWRMFVSGKEKPLDPGYVFVDLDRILLTYGSGEEQVQKELQAVGKDACLYSRTCPWRGDPPAENCIADPAVPCVIPE